MPKLLTDRVIRVLGSDSKKLAPGYAMVNTTSRSTDFGVALSPFNLGPCDLYGGFKAKLVENAWQFTKVYQDHVGSDGMPKGEYFDWAKRGWASNYAMRYPMGKGAKPAYSFWDGKCLDYIDARKEIYWPIYQSAAAKSPAFEKLVAFEASLPEDQELVLFDFDGLDHVRLNMQLKDVIEQTGRSMGHSFVLCAMLQYGKEVTLQEILEMDDHKPSRSISQPSLF